MTANAFPAYFKNTRRHCFFPLHLLFYYSSPNQSSLAVKLDGTECPTPVA